MNKDLDGEFAIKKGEDNNDGGNQGGGKPRPYITKNGSADSRNVGAGLAPTLEISPALQTSPAQQTSQSLRDSIQQPFFEGLHRLGLELTEQQLDQFLWYRQELLDWNTRINLTAITDPGEVMIKHFLDSLSLLLVYDVPDARLLDIGAGAGFPGLPLKIVRPQWHVVLLEATGKKTLFLRHMVEALQLRDVEIIHGRAEELAHKREHRAMFDIVTARAVSAL